MNLLLNEPATYGRVISHLISYRALPRVLSVLLTPETHLVPEGPYVKVIIDFTTEDLVVETYDLPQV
jgi:hypothetical protein